MCGSNASIEKIWIYPPLAFARLGGSETPLEAFGWGDSDDSPAGTGKTSILPSPTFSVNQDGTISEYVPDSISFKDGDYFRPVCPFFELHARWASASGAVYEGPVTKELLSKAGLALTDVQWIIEVANSKPYNMTLDSDNRIQSRTAIGGEDFETKKILGTCPEGSKEPIVPIDRAIPLGSARVIKPSNAFPELRLRFTPGKGVFYGPSNLKERWTDVDLADEFLFLNPRSTWCNWRATFEDTRSTPGGQYARDDEGTSYGLVDDICDGIITCLLPTGSGKSLQACTRIVVAPPDYAPDRRPVVSLADGLKDRVDRADVLSHDYFDDPDIADAEMLELMQRAYETASLINVDVFNDRINNQENPAIAMDLAIPIRPMEYIAFPSAPSLTGRPLPLAEAALQHHRRFQVMLVLSDLIKKNPGLLKESVRKPLDPNPFFDRRMPAVMRGSSGRALSLTRRQYEFILRWADLRSKR